MRMLRCLLPIIGFMFTVLATLFQIILHLATGILSLFVAVLVRSSRS